MDIQPSSPLEKSIFAAICCLFFCCGCAQEQGEVPAKWTKLPGGIESNFVTVVPGSMYEKNSALYHLFFGKHYREMWQKPVRVRVFDPHTDSGSFVPAEKGGGDQTYSIDVMGPDSLLYSIRSVNKDQAGILEDKYKWLPVKSVIRDQASALFPFGAAVCDELQDAAGIVGTDPELVFVPMAADNHIIAQSDSGFLAWLEIEPHISWKAHPRLGKPENILDTDEVLEMHQRHELKIDSLNYLKLRLLDILIGDWDRHDRQVDWGTKHINGTPTAFPIAMDRDMAFYRFNDGILPRITEKIAPKLTTFTEDYAAMDRYVFSSEKMDAVILGNISREEFLRKARELRNDLKPSVLDKAFGRLPESVRNHGLEVRDILEARLEKLDEMAVSLHTYIQELKNIRGD